MATQLSTQALDVLKQAEYVASVNRLFLTRQELPDRVYREVKEVCMRLGGKWNTASQTFLFAYDPLPAIAIVCANGQLPPKNPYSFFQTPASISEDMIRHGFTLFGCNQCDGYRHNQPLHACAYVPGNLRILEPSAGQGALARWVPQLYAQFERSDYVLHCCELHPINRALLQQQGLEVVATDFLSYQLAPGEPCYDLIVMNPPFHGIEYIDHIEHAWDMLSPNGGKLITLTPTSFFWREDSRCEWFRKLVRRYNVGEVPFVYPPGRFKESGTSVETALISLVKEDDDWKRKPFEGSHNWHCATLHVVITQNERLNDEQRAIWKQVTHGTLPASPEHPEWGRTQQVLRRLFASAVEQAKKDWIEIETDEETLLAMEYEVLKRGAIECQYEQHWSLPDPSTAHPASQAPRTLRLLPQHQREQQQVPQHAASDPLRPREHLQQTLFPLS